jgi:hypothetical protein
MLPWVAPVTLFTLVFAAADPPKERPWMNKPISEWTEADAKMVMTDSPWAKTVTARLDKTPPAKRIKILGVDIPVPGHPAANHPAEKPPAPPKPPVLALRWESARPIREAERTAHDTSDPALNDRYYALAVYGIPREAIANASKQVAATLKSQAVLKRFDKKDVKPVRVEISLREDGPVVIYWFAKSDEITWRDHNLEFDGQAAQWKFTQSFSLDDMMFQGNLEL